MNRELGVEGRERVRRNCVLVESPSPTVSQEPACPAFGAHIPGPSDCFLKKSSCSKGPCRSVLQCSPLLLLPPSGYRHGGPASYSQGANGELKNPASTVCLLAIHRSVLGEHGRADLKNHLLITGPQNGPDKTAVTSAAQTTPL